MIFSALAIGKIRLASKKRIFIIVPQLKETIIDEEESTGDENKRLRVDEEFELESSQVPRL